MTAPIAPRNADDVLEAVRWAAAAEQPLDVVGGASKVALGRPVAAEHRIELASLSGILLYEPEELVLTARAGTPLAEVERALAARNQLLAFEPPDLGALLGPANGTAAAVGGTLGGAIACNLAGPRRIRSGAARDHLLGFQAVSGRGEAFKSGGRVIKNVTGFDLSKLVTGSFGTLAVMTEVTVRALPAPEQTRTVLLLGRADDVAVRAMTEALQGPWDVSAAAHLPAGVAGRSALPAVADAAAAVTAIRIEGPGPSVEFRAAALRDALAAKEPAGELEAAESCAFWREVCDVRYFEGDRDRPVWRLSVPPAEGAHVAATVLGSASGEVFYDWGGGLVWLALAPSADAEHETVRRAVAAIGGHATLIRAAAAVRASVPVFQPQTPALAALTRRIKDGFDPKRVLNPGRMYEGV